MSVSVQYRTEGSSEWSSQGSGLPFNRSRRCFIAEVYRCAKPLTTLAGYPPPAERRSSATDIRLSHPGCVRSSEMVGARLARVIEVRRTR